MKWLLRLALGVSILCLIGSVAALIAGVGRVEERPPLRFDPEPFALPVGMEWHGESDFEVSVVNDSDETARIVGVEEFCGSACFSGTGLPATIPPRGRGRVTLRVKSDRPGPISEELNFFTDQPSQPRLTMRIEGTIPEATPLASPIHASKP